jgi:hypothetical protein
MWNVFAAGGFQSIDHEAQTHTETKFFYIIIQYTYINIYN